MIHIGLLGASGRMGQWVQKLAQEEFSAQITVTVTPKRGEPLDALLSCDVVIDFSMPEVMTELAKLCLARPEGSKMPAFAIGSTGWKNEGRTLLDQLAKRTPILIATNFSTGVAAMIQALKQVSEKLIRLGYSPVLTERHHIHKKDSPSGTALSLQRAISPSGPGNVQTHAIRAGEIIGDHEVSYVGASDELVFAHYAGDRSIFARGALQASLWLAQRRLSGQPLSTPFGVEALFD